MQPGGHSPQDPYTKAKIVSLAFANIKLSSFYPEDLQDWGRKNNANKTWSNFKMHFRQAFMEVLIVHSWTAHTSSYVANVASTQMCLTVPEANANTILFSELQ